MNPTVPFTLLWQKEQQDQPSHGWMTPEALGHVKGVYTVAPFHTRARAVSGGVLKTWEELWCVSLPLTCVGHLRACNLAPPVPYCCDDTPSLTYSNAPKLRTLSTLLTRKKSSKTSKLFELRSPSPPQHCHLALGESTLSQTELQQQIHPKSIKMTDR